MGPRKNKSAFGENIIHQFGMGRGGNKKLVAVDDDASISNIRKKLLPYTDRQPPFELFFFFFS